MNYKVITVLALVLLSPVAQAAGQILKGYQHEIEPGIRWPWKAFPESVSVDVSSTNKDWVKLDEQAVFGAATRTFILKGETGASSKEGIMISFNHNVIVSEKTPLNWYVDNLKNDARIACAGTKGTSHVDVLRTSEEDIVIQYLLEDCGVDVGEIQRIMKSHVGFHTISYVSGGKPSKEQLQQMRQVVESAQYIDLRDGKTGE